MKIIQNSNIMKRVFIFCLLTLLLCSCKESEENSTKVELIERQDIPLTRSEKVVSNSANKFAFELIKQMNSNEKNFLISPMSAHMALSMLCNGADGETLVEIANTLGYENIDDINNYNQKLVNILPTLDNTAELKLANGIWFRNAIPLKESFIDKVKTFFCAQASQFTDYNDARTEINNWCDKNTEHKISSIIPEGCYFDSVLANALYFAGTWRGLFDKQNTKDALFNNEDGTTSIVEMMETTDYYNFSNASDMHLQLIDIPFGNLAYSFYAMLPEEGYHLNDLLSNISLSNIENIEKGFIGREVNLKMPKFELENNYDLVNTFKAMGMENSFSNPDFSNMGVEMYIDHIFNNNKIVINENGAEAAASTAITTVFGSPIGGSDTEQQTTTFTLDRPFCFYIKEKSTNTVLFFGKINELKTK